MVAISLWTLRLLTALVIAAAYNIGVPITPPRQPVIGGFIVQVRLDRICRDILHPASPVLQRSCNNVIAERFTGNICLSLEIDTYQQDVVRIGDDSQIHVIDKGIERRVLGVPVWNFPCIDAPERVRCVLFNR